MLRIGQGCPGQLDETKSGKRQGEMDLETGPPAFCGLHHV